MSKKNKFYWLEGVTERGVNSLLTDENSKFSWLRPQRNRRVLVGLMVAGIIAVAMGSYWPTFKRVNAVELSSGVEIALFSVWAIFVVLCVLVGYLLLRISVRGIGDAPNELLDERQIRVRDTSFRYAYYAMGYVLLGLFFLMLSGPELRLFEPEGNDGSYVTIAVIFAFASMPSMVLAWRERDI